MPDTSELASVNKALKEHSNAPRRYVYEQTLCKYCCGCLICP